MVSLVMSGPVILKYFHHILDKKDPPEDKKLHNILNMSGPLSKVIATHCH